MCMSNNVPMVVYSHCTGDARYCVSTVRDGIDTGGYGMDMGCDGLLVRRKILRLYWLARCDDRVRINDGAGWSRYM